jgi:ribose transport system substrate-binding protein
MRRVLLALLAALALSTGCKQGSGPQASRLQIAVIPKGTTHEYWKSVQAGATDAGKKYDVDILYKGPLKEDDRSAQIQVVQQFIGDHVAGIVVAPLDSRALVEPIQLAGSQKIPVVVIDSALDAEAGKDFVSYVATDNHHGGEIAGDQLAKLLDNKGKVVLLRYAEGSASTEQREQGFLDAISKHKDIQVLVSNRYGGATTDSAEKTALNMVDTLKEADGIFCPNESTTAGMLSALRTAGLTGKARFVGFDATSQLVDALKNKECDALVAQDPYKMGYEAVETMVKHIHGEQVPLRVDTGVHLITRETLSDPEIVNLLKKS